MKPSAYLINVSRAHVIQEIALFNALKQRWIAGGAIDVWYRYPDDLGQPLHGSELPLHELDNVILTPHAAAWTEAMVKRRWQRIAENLDHLARGADHKRRQNAGPLALPRVDL